MEHPRPGWSETQPAEWLRSVHSATRPVLYRRPDAEISAVGLSGQMHAVVPIGEDHQPLGPGILWSDLRAQSMVDPLRSRANASGVALGNPVVAGMSATTLAWLVEHDPCLRLVPGSGRPTVIVTEPWLPRSTTRGGAPPRVRGRSCPHPT